MRTRIKRYDYCAYYIIRTGRCEIVKEKCEKRPRFSSRYWIGRYTRVFMRYNILYRFEAVVKYNDSNNNNNNNNILLYRSIDRIRSSVVNSV